jgi:eukaryotic-like serine/threonine-protein kinase
MADLENAISATLGEDFEILRQIGVGSKSFVYLARENALRRLVAIKVLQPEQAKDEETRKRFARESRAMAKIRQKNVIAVHRVGELNNDLPFIVMEYVPGRTLKDALEAQGAYSVERSQDVLLQVASALAAAHQEGIIHRDLRPENVIEEAETGRIVLTDFGLAGISPTSDVSETKLTMQGQLLGDPQYASPEQLQGEPVTEHTDSYSLGILGYELLTLRLPYDAKSNVEMLTAHLQKEPIALTELRPEVGSALADLLGRSLRKKPTQRPTSADIKVKLEEIIAGPGTAAARAGHPEGSPPGALQAFKSELSRRHVGKVLLMYMGIGGPIAVVAPDMVNALTWVPSGSDGVIITVFLIGIPVTAVLAWAYDITSEGIKRTEDEDGSRLSRGRMQALQLGGLALTLVVMGVLGWWFFGR